MKAKISELNNYWARQSTQTKITLLMGLVFLFLLIFFGTTKKIQTLYESEYINPDTGKPIPAEPCTIYTGPNQCRIYKEEFITDKILVTTISLKRGSTTCCKTIISGGEASESCFTTSKNLPKCPTGYIKE